MILEICAQSYQAAINAAAGGADRLELCAHLGGGGITPSLGVLSILKKEISIPIYVLIRPRPGHFYYTPGECSIMIRDIEYFAAEGADGIVSGCLTRDDLPDLYCLQRMLQAAKGLPFTFHRAFESIKDPFSALDQLSNLGINRILTGGKSGNAFESRNELKTLQEYAGSRLIILAGSGVNLDNLFELLHSSRVKEVHSSAKYNIQSLITTEIDLFDSDPVIVKALSAICRSYSVEH
ncbi:MAG: copper homeostasis protein CutC [Saprospiraceae bacterium]|nr:copper homeostasis protein CutC [Saprospiraceae bacterium]